MTKHHHFNLGRRFGGVKGIGEKGSLRDTVDGAEIRLTTWDKTL